MSKNHYHDQYKDGDYPTYCDICGQKCWFTQTTVLHKYTGRGNLLVCPNCNDAIDYSLVPWKVIPEVNPKITRNNNYAANPEDVPDSAELIDFSTFDPLNGSTAPLSWDNLDTFRWEDWEDPWGSV